MPATPHAACAQGVDAHMFMPQELTETTHRLRPPSLFLPLAGPILQLSRYELSKLTLAADVMWVES